MNSDSRCQYGEFTDNASCCVSSPLTLSDLAGGILLCAMHDLLLTQFVIDLCETGVMA